MAATTVRHLDSFFKFNLTKSYLLSKKKLSTTFQEQVDNKEYLFHVENLSYKGDSPDNFNGDLNSVLSSKEKLVVYLYFGFHTDDSKSLGQIASFMDISRNAVQQMLKDALAKMEGHLKDF